MRVLITGSAGFIGFHLARRLLEAGAEILGYDGFTDYYDVALKRRRHESLAGYPGFRAEEAMLEDSARLCAAAQGFAPDIIVHLAAQAGVRYALEAPRAYIDANVTGTFNLLEAARLTAPRHLLIASTSSVYGGNRSLPFRETDKATAPLSLYAATKLAGEALAHSYAHLHGLPTTAFRFFTVYGPWGRPDMALFKFTRAILAGEPIEIYNRGELWRDFTYIDDLVDAMRGLIDAPPPGAEPAAPQDSLSPVAPFRVVNIGHGKKVRLLDFVAALEAALGREAIRHYAPMQKGDAPATWADASLLHALTGAAPQTPLEEGVARFVAWYREHYAGSC